MNAHEVPLNADNSVTDACARLVTLIRLGAYPFWYTENRLMLCREAFTAQEWLRPSFYDDNDLKSGGLFSLECLSLSHLRMLDHLAGRHFSFPIPWLLRRKLRADAEWLRFDDVMIRHCGVTSLDERALDDACLARALPPVGSMRQRQNALTTWLRFSEEKYLDACPSMLIHAVALSYRVAVRPSP